MERGKCVCKYTQNVCFEIYSLKNVYEENNLQKRLWGERFFFLRKMHTRRSRLSSRDESEKKLRKTNKPTFLVSLALCTKGGWKCPSPPPLPNARMDDDVRSINALLFDLNNTLDNIFCYNLTLHIYVYVKIHKFQEFQNLTRGFRMPIDICCDWLNHSLTLTHKKSKSSHRVAGSYRIFVMGKMCVSMNNITMYLCVRVCVYTTTTKSVLLYTTTTTTKIQKFSLSSCRIV